MNSRILCRLGFHGKWEYIKIVNVYGAYTSDTDYPQAQRAIMRCSECGIIKRFNL